MITAKEKIENLEYQLGRVVSFLNQSSNELEKYYMEFVDAKDAEWIDQSEQLTSLESQLKEMGEKQKAYDSCIELLTKEKEQAQEYWLKARKKRKDKLRSLQSQLQAANEVNERLAEAALPNDKETEEWFEIWIGKGCSASSGIYKWRNFIKERITQLLSKHK